MSRVDGSTLGDAMRQSGMSATAIRIREQEARRRAAIGSLSFGEASREAWKRLGRPLLRVALRVARLYATIRATAGFGSPEDIEMVMRARLPALDVKLYRSTENPTWFDVTFSRGDKVFVSIAQDSELKDVNTLTMRVIKMAYGPEFAAGPKGA